MQLIINDEEVSDELIAKRRAEGIDRYDEVWNGVYVMATLGNTEHQDIVMAFSMALASVWDMRGLGRTQPGANISDRRQGWKLNHRIPDVLCFTADTQAEDCDTHWCGGPEFAVEIASRGERTIDKLDFYVSVGTIEVLVLDRYPWQLWLFRVDRTSGKMVQVAASSKETAEWIETQIVPVKFMLDLKSMQIRIAESSGTLLRELPICHRD